MVITNVNATLTQLMTVALVTTGVLLVLGSGLSAGAIISCNMLGGKLIACLSTTDLIRKIWKDRYGDELVGLTTTSLYGSYSMYNSIPYWKKLGSSKGTALIKPNDVIYKYWLRFIGKRRIKKAMKTSWGRLFQKY